MKKVFLLFALFLIGCSPESETIETKSRSSSSISSFNSGANDNSSEEEVNWMVFSGTSQDVPDKIFAEFAIKDSLMIGNYFLSGNGTLINLQGKIDSLGNFQLAQLFLGDSIGTFNGKALDTNFSQLIVQQMGVDSVFRKMDFSSFQLRDSALRINPLFGEFQRTKEHISPEETLLINETIKLSQFGKRDFVFHYFSLDEFGNPTTEIRQGFWQNGNYGLIATTEKNKVSSIELYEDSIVIRQDIIEATAQPSPFVGTFLKIK